MVATIIGSFTAWRRLTSALTIIWIVIVTGLVIHTSWISPPAGPGYFVKVDDAYLSQLVERKLSVNLFDDVVREDPPSPRYVVKWESVIFVVAAPVLGLWLVLYLSIWVALSFRGSPVNVGKQP